MVVNAEYAVTLGFGGAFEAAVEVLGGQQSQPNSSFTCGPWRNTFGASALQRVRSMIRGSIAARWLVVGRRARRMQQPEYDLAARSLAIFVAR